MSFTLLNGVTSDGSGPELTFNRYQTDVERPLVIFVWGTFDGATVTIEMQPDNSPEIIIDSDEWFVPEDNGTFQAKGAKSLAVSASKLRLTVSGAGGSTALNAVAQ